MEQTKRRTVRVQLYRTEDDCYNELWKVVGTKGKFYARHVFGVYKRWYYVCDPLGYCELDYPADDIDFIVCDQDNHKLFTSNNTTKSFPTLKETIREKYSELVKAGSIIPQDYQEWKHWLLSYKDEKTYSKEIAAMNGYDENWLYARDKYVREETIPDSSFTYLGKQYKITRLICEHTVCHKQYGEIQCTDDPLIMDDYIKYPHCYELLGMYFDTTEYGPVAKHRPENRVKATA